MLDCPAKARLAHPGPCSLFTDVRYMKYFSISPIAACRSAVRNWQLITQLTVRDVASRYRGSSAGILWSLIGPLLSLAMYTFVFGVVLRARWGVAGESTFDFALTLFAGLVVHGLVSDVLMRAPHTIAGNPSYVKQIVFPLEILSIVSILSSLFNATISLALLLCFWAFVHEGLYSAVFIIPFLLFPLCLIALGVGWAVAATTVYFRDLGQLVSFVSSGLLFLSPVFYPASAVPVAIRPLLDLNPLTFVIEGVRGALIHGSIPSLESFAIYLLISFCVVSLGFAWFQKVRSGFGDVV